MIPIYGLQKTTLLDYKGYVASTIFFGHCNYRCPFCQNSLLVGAKITEPEITKEELFTHLHKRQGIIEGVCITGGEPTLYKELPSFLAEIKELGYLIKLDTNGTNPKMMMELVRDRLIDYVAMDIKNALPYYSVSAGTTQTNLKEIEASVDFLKSGSIPYEFRTTVVKEQHTKERMRKIGKWLSGPSTYILQNFKDSEHVIQKGLHGLTQEELQEMKTLLLSDLPNTHIRGEMY
ncbi:MAG: anaerobic ribonucleoside-triphosphate reductase activating protein [bacterium]|nr:anaerobic ribonucleoside-triphosphate reductase activating protein [bacterium]